METFVQHQSSIFVVSFGFIILVVEMWLEFAIQGVLYTVIQSITSLTAILY